MGASPFVQAKSWAWGARQGQTQQVPEEKTSPDDMAIRNHAVGVTGWREGPRMLRKVRKDWLWRCCRFYKCNRCSCDSKNFESQSLYDNLVIKMPDLPV